MNRLTAPASPSSRLPDTSNAAGSLGVGHLNRGRGHAGRDRGVGKRQRVAAPAIRAPKPEVPSFPHPLPIFPTPGAYSALRGVRNSLCCKVLSSQSPSGSPRVDLGTSCGRVPDLSACVRPSSSRQRGTPAARRFRFTIGAHALIVGALLFVGSPVLFIAGSSWGARAVIADLLRQNAALRVENANYRDATGQLASQLSSLQEAADTLRATAEVDPQAARAMERLPASITHRAMGGG